MVQRTGRKGAAGVGDTNPGVDVYVESIGEFSNGSQVVDIAVVGTDGEDRIELPALHRGRLMWSADSRNQESLLLKARTLAKATLHGSVSARYCGVVGVDERGETIGRFVVSRNK